MFKNLLLYVKYPSVAGIIIVIWIGSTLLIVHDRTLPIEIMIVINMIVSVVISIIGFRIDKK